MIRPLAAFVPLALAVSLGSACRPAPGGPAAAGADSGAPLAAADLAAIRAIDSALTTAPTIEGREAIQRFWGGLVDAYQVKVTVASDEVEGRGDLAYARGHFTLDATPKSAGAAPLHDEGKFLVVLRRQPDGGWRYVADMYSSDLPAPK